MAKIQGGLVTLNIDEESLVGKLTYCGHELFINNVFCNDLKCFRLMLAHEEKTAAWLIAILIKISALESF